MAVAPPARVFTSGVIELRAFAWASASLKTLCQVRLSRLVPATAELFCMARIARFGAMAMMDRSTASSFSL
jgi:hypothetical protein